MRICSENARPRSTTGVNMAMKTGAASPNSTADMPRRSRRSALIWATDDRTRAATHPDARGLGEDKIHSRRDILRLHGFGAAVDHAVTFLIRNEQPMGLDMVNRTRSFVRSTFQK